MSSKNKNKQKQKAPLPSKKPSANVAKKRDINWIWVAFAMIVVATFIIYFRAINFHILYGWDDQLYIRNDTHIKALSWENIKFIFTNIYASNYHPLTLLFYALDYKMGSGETSIFLHLNNVIIHLINTYLVFVIIKRISPKNQFVALITAALFAVHPMHVESVAWVSERKDVLYAFFFLLSLIKYSDYLKSEKIKHLVFAAIFFLLSCLSKSAAVVLPLAMLLFDYYTNRKYSWKMLIEKIPFFTIALIFGVGAIYSQKTTGAIQNMAPTLTFIEHISVISWAFLGYLYRAFIPINQSAIYPYPMEIGSTLPIMYYISILIVALLLAFVWYSRKWGKEIVFGFLFFIATIILVLQFIPVGAAIMADRYTYIPYIGIFFIVAKIFERLSSLESSKINYKQYSLVVLALGFLAFAVIAFERVKVWETEETLFTDVIAKYPKCSIAHLNRGNYYKDYFAKVVYANDTTKKNAYLRKSIIDFENSLKCILMKAERAKGYCNLGDTKMQLGDWTGAKSEFDDGIYTDSVVAGTEAYFLRAFANQQLKNYLAAFSDYNKAIISNPNNTGDKNTQSYTNCGVINNILNDYSSAIKNFDKALLLNPNYGDAYSYRAFSKFQLGNFKDAIVDYDKAIALTANEKNAENYTNKGIAENNLKDYTTAVTDFDKALAIDVNYANAYTNRGCSKFYLKDYQGALDDYKKVNQLNPGDVNAIKNIEITSKLLGNKPPSPLYVTY